MTATQIAKEAMSRTSAVAKFVNAEIREKLAIAEVAILIDGQDDSISADVRMLRLTDAISMVRIQVREAA